MPCRKILADIIGHIVFEKISFSHYTQTVLYKRSASEMKGAQSTYLHGIIQELFIMIFKKDVGI